jgi:hypothetical protein
MDDRRQQPIPPGIPDRQLSKEPGKIFGEAMQNNYAYIYIR